MWKQEYKQELNAIGPDPEQMARLRWMVEQAKQGLPETREPTHYRPGRRAVATVVLCAALAVSALAAGPSLWQTLEAHLGAYAPFAREVEGTATGQGIRLELLSAVSDGYTARVYYTLTDQKGGRFNDHTRVHAWLKGTTLGGVALGSHVVSYDADSGTLLMETSVEGVDTSQPVELEVLEIDPAYYMLWDGRFEPVVPEEPLETETTAEGEVVLKAGQNPQTSPDTDVVSISSMGFDGEGNFHIRLTLAEGYSNDALLAVPYNAAGEQMGTTKAQTAVARGVDSLIEGITQADVADIAFIRVYGPYRGPEETIEGTWTLPVELKAAEQKIIQVGRTLVDGFYVERIEVSGMNIAVFFRDGDKNWFPVWVTDRAGETAGVPLDYMNFNADTGLSCGIWSYETPIDLKNLTALTLLGETFPLD